MKQAKTNHQVKASGLREHAASDSLRLISSMAPRLILEDLITAFSKKTGMAIQLSPMGGVDAANKVKAGEPFDITVLSRDAIEQLVSQGHLFPDIFDLAISQVAVAVQAGAAHPYLNSEEAVKNAVLNAKSISYSTGPSGRALAALFEKWGISQNVEERLITPPPGTPVGSLIANGEVELGFQQKSELIHIQGIDVVGPLPEEIQINTTFSAAVCLGTKKPKEVRQLLEFLCSPQADNAKQRQGMQPA